MGERYFITGVQLGMLIALPEQAQRRKLVDDIEDNQFLLNTDKTSYEDFLGEITEDSHNTQPIPKGGVSHLPNDTKQELNKEINKDYDNKE